MAKSKLFAKIRITFLLCLLYISFVGTKELLELNHTTINDGNTADAGKSEKNVDSTDLSEDVKSSGIWKELNTSAIEDGFVSSKATLEQKKSSQGVARVRRFAALIRRYNPETGQYEWIRPVSPNGIGSRYQINTITPAPRTPVQPSIYSNAYQDYSRRYKIPVSSGTSLTASSSKTVAPPTAPRKPIPPSIYSKAYQSYSRRYKIPQSSGTFLATSSSKNATQTPVVRSYVTPKVLSSNTNKRSPFSPYGSIFGSSDRNYAPTVKTYATQRVDNFGPTYTLRPPVTQKPSGSASGWFPSGTSTTTRVVVTAAKPKTGIQNGLFHHVTPPTRSYITPSVINTTAKTKVIPTGWFPNGTPSPVTPFGLVTTPAKHPRGFLNGWGPRATSATTKAYNTPRRVMTRPNHKVTSFVTESPIQRLKTVPRMSTKGITTATPHPMMPFPVLVRPNSPYKEKSPVPLRKHQVSCTAETCRHGGTCIGNKDGISHCMCLFGFRGHTCSEVMPVCGLPPCEDRGDCVKTFEGEVCVCIDEESPEHGRLCGMKRQNTTNGGRIKFLMTEKDVYTGEIILGILLAIVLFLAIAVTIHFCRVNAKMDNIRRKYFAAVASGNIPPTLPPDWCETSNALCRSFFCCGPDPEEENESKLKAEEGLKSLIQLTQTASRTSGTKLTRRSSKHAEKSESSELLADSSQSDSEAPRSRSISDARAFSARDLKSKSRSGMEREIYSDKYRTMSISDARAYTANFGRPSSADLGERRYSIGRQRSQSMPEPAFVDGNRRFSASDSRRLSIANKRSSSQAFGEPRRQSLGPGSQTNIEATRRERGEYMSDRGSDGPRYGSGTNVQSARRESVSVDRQRAQSMSGQAGRNRAASIAAARAYNADRTPSNAEQYGSQRKYSLPGSQNFEPNFHAEDAVYAKVEKQRAQSLPAQRNNNVRSRNQSISGQQMSKPQAHVQGPVYRESGYVHQERIGQQRASVAMGGARASIGARPSSGVAPVQDPIAALEEFRQRRARDDNEAGRPEDQYDATNEESSAVEDGEEEGEFWPPPYNISENSSPDKSGSRQKFDSIANAARCIAASNLPYTPVRKSSVVHSSYDQQGQNASNSARRPHLNKSSNAVKMDSSGVVDRANTFKESLSDGQRSSDSELHIVDDFAQNTLRSVGMATAGTLGGENSLSRFETSSSSKNCVFQGLVSDNKTTDVDSLFFEELDKIGSYLPLISPAKQTSPPPLLQFSSPETTECDNAENGSVITIDVR